MSVKIIHFKQFTRILPDFIKAFLQTLYTFFSTVSKSHDPAKTVPLMVCDLFYRFLRYTSQCLIFAFGKLRIKEQIETIYECLTNDSLCIITIRLLGN